MAACPLLGVCVFIPGNCTHVICRKMSWITPCQSNHRFLEAESPPGPREREHATAGFGRGKGLRVKECQEWECHNQDVLAGPHLLDKNLGGYRKEESKLRECPQD